MDRDFSEPLRSSSGARGSLIKAQHVYELVNYEVPYFSSSGIEFLSPVVLFLLFQPSCFVSSCFSNIPSLSCLEESVSEWQVFLTVKSVSPENEPKR